MSPRQESRLAAAQESGKRSREGKPQPKGRGATRQNARGEPGEARRGRPPQAALEREIVEGALGALCSWFLDEELETVPAGGCRGGCPAAAGGFNYTTSLYTCSLTEFTVVAFPPGGNQTPPTGELDSPWRGIELPPRGNYPPLIPPTGELPRWHARRQRGRA